MALDIRFKKAKGARTTFYVGSLKCVVYGNRYCTATLESACIDNYGGKRRT